VRVAYQARCPAGSSKYELSNSNAKEHFECVIYVDDLDLIVVAAGRRTVGADDAEADEALAHQVTAGIVDDDRVRNTVLAELPGGEARALVARPGPSTQTWIGTPSLWAR
jgi:hypothetical protein